MSMPLESRFAELDGLKLHYLVAGPKDTEPVLLLHGWPTSSFLWRRVMPGIATKRRVVALDLAGFGRSDKPLDASYSFRFHERLITGFVDHLEADRIGLAVHDLGGPLGFYWAMKNSHRLERLAVLNTLVYPEMSWAVVAFVASTRLPIISSLVSSQWGLKEAMHLGVHDRSRLTGDVIPGVQAPFADKASRKALLKAGHGLHPKGFKDLGAWVPTIEVPVRVIYGARDRILPDIAKTAARIQKDVPHAEVTELSDCGHFLQEERPEEIGEMLGRFFA